MRQAFLLLIAAGSIAAARPAPADRFSEAIGAALQADGARAVRALDGIDLSGLPERDRLAGACIRERFGPGSKPAPYESASLTDRSLSIYRDYWHRSLLRPEKRSLEEKLLETNLRRLLGARQGGDFDTLETMLAARLRAEGAYSLQGRTGLLRELMVWTKQEERVMPALLPEGPHDVKVFLLDGFKSLGWGAYATCTRASTGGWATDKAIFAVVPKYASLDSEEFRVTFMGHEAQHLADKQRFKTIQPWELEYRAKLTELAQADATRARVVGKFLDDQGEDPASPHSYANRRVLTTMAARLGLGSPKDIATTDLARVQATALSLLQEDSARREQTAQRPLAL